MNANEDVDYSNAIKVDSVPDEYKILRKTECKICNTVGSLKRDKQRLIFKNDNPFDVLDCTCENCGGKCFLTFDISSFFGTFP